jgi:hypothetical protein
LNGGVRISACFRSRFLDRHDLVLAPRDIGTDCVLGAYDVGRRVSTPSDGVPELPFVLLQGFGGTIDCSTGCLRGIS